MKKRILQSLAIGIFLLGMCLSIASIPVNMPELSEEKPIEIESTKIETETINMSQTETVNEIVAEPESESETETQTKENLKSERIKNINTDTKR